MASNKPTMPAPGGPDSAAGARNILISAAGRRVILMRLFQQTLDELGLRGRAIPSDITFASSAMQGSDQRIKVPPLSDPQCLDAMLDIVRQHAVCLIIPTIDPELPFYARHRDAFAELGCAVNVSSPDAIGIGNDKVRTYEFLRACDLPTIQQWLFAHAAEVAETLPYPVIVKPRGGSASIGISVARSPRELLARGPGENLVVQSMARGYEYTVDAYIDPSGRCRCCVPRLRLETRGGEVSKGVTHRNGAVAEIARRTAEALPGGRGVINIQIFYDPDAGRAAVIEINCRFGGGYPLTHQAGAPMARWVLEDALGIASTARDDQWRDGVVMLRYDDAVFVPAGQAGVTLPEQVPIVGIKDRD